jgi:hypothetical protein
MTMLYIWTLPYKAPQDALGLFTLREAARFLGITSKAIRERLKGRGAFDTDKFHLEVAA